jgi:hypothetical protein
MELSRPAPLRGFLAIGILWTTARLDVACGGNLNSGGPAACKSDVDCPIGSTCAGAVSRSVCVANGQSAATDGTGPSGGTPSTDSGTSLAMAGSDAGTAECDDYFAAQYTRCGGPVLPASEVARIRGRFEQVCQNQMALPGSGITPAGLEACALALSASPCELPDGPPVECSFGGSLSGGDACTDPIQCASGQCRGTVKISPAGPMGPITCGTCLPTVAVGQVCDQGNFSAGCPSGALCLTSDTSAPTPTYSCTALVQGDIGAACDDLSASCKTGLYCATQTRQCTPLGDAGATCGVGGGNPGGCAAPLSCVSTSSASTCGLGSQDSFCLTDYDCSPGLGCVPGPCSSSIARIGCSESGTCAPVAWAAPGQSCDLYQTRCLVGSCLGSSWGPPPTSIDGGSPSGVCPTVTPDGQPCAVGNSTCDTFSQCFQGTCMLLDSFVCK